MESLQFDRDEMANWHAQEHLEVDPGVQAIDYLGDFTQTIQNLITQFPAYA